MRKRLALYLLFVLTFTLLRAETEKEPLFFDATYTGDVVGNLYGGIKQGATYLGYATLGVGFNTENVNWWKGGELYISGGNTHGGEPSAEFIGDLHIVDNIEAGIHTFLQEFWYKQSFSDKFDFKIGLQDLNAEFALSDESGIFLHSSFALNTVLSANVPTPVFPITGLGLQFGWNISDLWRIQICAFDGQVTDFDENPYNVKWHLNKNDGFLSCLELQYRVGENGVCKLGTYFHSEEERYGLYLIGSRRIENIALLGQVAWAPKTKNECYAQVDAGINFYNLFTKKHDDILGFACSSNLLDNKHKHETVLELTYKYQIVEQLFIQPDLQYVIHPSGSVEDLDNALVAILRFGIEF